MTEIIKRVYTDDRELKLNLHCTPTKNLELQKLSNTKAVVSRRFTSFYTLNMRMKKNMKKNVDLRKYTSRQMSPHTKKNILLAPENIQGEFLPEKNCN